MKLFLPAVVPEEDATTPIQCLICGAVTDVETQEMVSPAGIITMTVDSDLCLECACHLWRGAKEVYGEKQVKFYGFEILKRYHITAPAMKRNREIQ